MMSFPFWENSSWKTCMNSWHCLHFRHDLCRILGLKIRVDSQQHTKSSQKSGQQFVLQPSGWIFWCLDCTSSDAKSYLYSSKNQPLSSLPEKWTKQRCFSFSHVIVSYKSNSTYPNLSAPISLKWKQISMSPLTKLRLQPVATFASFQCSLGY